MVVLFQPSSNLARLHSNHGIVRRRVIGSAVEDFRSNGSFLEKFVASFQLLLNNIGEELLAAGTVSKRMTCKNIVQFAMDRGCFSVREAACFVSPVENWFSCCPHGA